jgi:hypothetical protein
MEFLSQLRSGFLRVNAEENVQLIQCVERASQKQGALPQARETLPQR